MMIDGCVDEEVRGSQIGYTMLMDGWRSGREDVRYIMRMDGWRRGRRQWAT
jgi:hypothetical protein